MFLKRVIYFNKNGFVFSLISKISIKEKVNR